MSESCLLKSALVNRYFTFLSLLLTTLLISTCSNEASPESVSKWIAEDNIGQITTRFEELTTEEASLSESQPGKKGVIRKEKSIIIEGVFKSKYGKGVDYFLSKFWNTPHGYYGNHILEQCFKHEVPIQLSELLMLYMATNQMRSELNRNQLLMLLNNAEDEELRQVFTDFIYILTDTSGSKRMVDFTKLQQSNWRTDKSGYGFLYPVLENISSIRFNEVKALLQYLIKQGRYRETLSLIKKTQSPPQGYSKVSEVISKMGKLAEEKQELKAEIPGLEKGIPNLQKNLKELEDVECEKVYGEVHKLLDNKGLLGTPRYIVTVDYEEAILNTFSTYSRAGRFSLPAKLLTKKIALTDANGFTQYWPQYRQVEDCEWERIRNLTETIEARMSSLSTSKRRIQEIEAEIESLSSMMKIAFNDMGIISADENAPNLKELKIDISMTTLPGKKIWNTQCSVCHLEDGGGLIGPNMTDNYWIHGYDMATLTTIIKEGAQDKGMIAWGAILSKEQITQVANYIVEDLVGSTPESPKNPEGDIFKQ